MGARLFIDLSGILRHLWLIFKSQPTWGCLRYAPHFLEDAFDPADVVRTAAGNFRVTWQSCTMATVEITSPLGNLTFDIMPLTPPPIGACAP